MKRQRYSILTAVVSFTAASLFAGCAYNDGCDMDDCGACAAWSDVTTAIASVRPTEGNAAKGMVTFIDVDGGVRVRAQISGLTPNAKHGFHIHEFGYCGSADATCTGGHYDPEKSGHHALPGASTAHHAGDMGNLVADASGKASYDAVIKGISVAGKNAIIGRAIIIHAQPDDGGQPTGNAGARVGVGDIGIAQPEMTRN